MKPLVRAIFALAILWPCRPALADRVAVLPVSYRLVWEGGESVEKASAIEEEVVAAVSESRFEPVTGQAVQDAAAAASGGVAADCQSRECLAEVASRLKVENAVFVAVGEEGLMANVEIALARGESQKGQIAGSFKALRSGVRSMVKQAIGEPVENEPPQAEADGGVAPPEVKISERPRSRWLDPVPFAATAGVTGALAIAWVAVEAVGYAKLRRLEGDSGYDWSKGEAEKLQIADRVLLATAAAGAAATIVLGVFTDFKKERRPTLIRALVPTAMPRGGMLAIEGRF